VCGHIGWNCSAEHGCRIDDVGKQQATTSCVAAAEGRNDVLLRCVVSFLWCLRHIHPRERSLCFTTIPYPADLFVRQHAVSAYVVICWRQIRR
jgi:hypothetical protein